MSEKETETVHISRISREPRRRRLIEGTYFREIDRRGVYLEGTDLDVIDFTVQFQSVLCLPRVCDVSEYKAI